MARPHNSGSAVRTVEQFCAIKGAKGNIEIMLMASLKKKSYSGKFGHFDPKIVRPHNFALICCCCCCFNIFNFAQ